MSEAIAVPIFDTRRHLEHFDPTLWNEKNIPIHVIGVGATGSNLVRDLTNLGISNIIVYDDDIVEAHNLPNQLYRLCDVGKPKVEALKQIVLEKTGIEIKISQSRVTKDTSLSGVVFCLVDSMAARKEIWTANRFNKNIKLYLETRMGPDAGCIYVPKTGKYSEFERYESTLYEDSQTEESACGTTITVGYTASTLAGVVCSMFVVFSKSDVGAEILHFEYLFQLGEEVNFSF